MSDVPTFGDASFAVTAGAYAPVAVAAFGDASLRVTAAGSAPSPEPTGAVLLSVRGAAFVPAQALNSFAFVTIAPPTFGAFAGAGPPLITSVVVNTVELLTVTVDRAGTATGWTIVPLDPVDGAQLVIDVMQTSPTTFVLVTTTLMPGGSYTVGAIFDTSESAPAEDTYTFLVEADALGTDGEPYIQTTGGVLPYPYGLLEALTFALGKEAQTMAGVPACSTTANFAVGAANLFVTSTFGFPGSGNLWAPGQKKLAYTSKTDTAFVGVTKEHEDYLVLPARSLLTLVSRDITLPEYGYTWR